MTYCYRPWLENIWDSREWRAHILFEVPLIKWRKHGWKRSPGKRGIRLGTHLPARLCCPVSASTHARRPAIETDCHPPRRRQRKRKERERDQGTRKGSGEGTRKGSKERERGQGTRKGSGEYFRIYIEGTRKGSNAKARKGSGEYFRIYIGEVDRN